MSNTDLPAVAVITPTGLHPTRLPFIQELYESLRAQALTNWEWIIALNGPRADPGLIPSAITRDSRVTVVANADPGPAHARNAALNHVRAPRVAFADDDDQLPPLSLAVRKERALVTGLGWVAGLSAAQRLSESLISPAGTPHRRENGPWWPPVDVAPSLGQ